MKKKVSIVTSGHPYYDERIFYKFARSLTRNGYLVSIICSTVESELDIVKDNVHITGFDGSNLKKSVKLNKFEELLRNFQPDVIICCEPLPILAANKIRKEKKSVRVIYDVTEWYPHQNMLKNLKIIKRIINSVYLFSFNIFAASLCNLLIIGEKSKAVPYKIFLPFLKKIVIDYYPSKEYFKFTMSPYDNNSFTIGYVGIINEQRGIFTFLEVLKKISSLYPSINLKAKIIGDFEDELIQQKVYKFINANKEINFVFTPRVNYEELSDHLKDVDICLDLREKNFVYNNSFPIKIFEYMACGKPIIYSDIKPLLKFKDLVQFGFLVDPSNIESVCNKIALYIGNHSLLQTHSQAARDLLERKYNWESIEHLLLNAIKYS